MRILVFFIAVILSISFSACRKKDLPNSIPPVLSIRQVDSFSQFSWKASIQADFTGYQLFRTSISFIADPDDYIRNAELIFSSNFRNDTVFTDTVIRNEAGFYRLILNLGERKLMSKEVKGFKDLFIDIGTVFEYASVNPYNNQFYGFFSNFYGAGFNFNDDHPVVTPNIFSSFSYRNTVFGMMDGIPSAFIPPNYSNTISVAEEKELLIKQILTVPGGLIFSQNLAIKNEILFLHNVNNIPSLVMYNLNSKQVVGEIQLPFAECQSLMLSNNQEKLWLVGSASAAVFTVKPDNTVVLDTIKNVAASSTRDASAISKNGDIGIVGEDGRILNNSLNEIGILQKDNNQMQFLQHLFSKNGKYVYSLLVLNNTLHFQTNKLEDFSLLSSLNLNTGIFNYACEIVEHNEHLYLFYNNKDAPIGTYVKRLPVLN